MNARKQEKGRLYMRWMDEIKVNKDVTRSLTN